MTGSKKRISGEKLIMCQTISGNVPSGPEKNIYRSIYPVFMFLCVTQSGMFAEHSPLFNSVRIVHFHSSLLCDSLMDRIQRSGYNYAAVSFPFRASNQIVGDGDVYANLQDDVCGIAAALSSRGLRLIPLIPMSSKWALQWRVLQRYENPVIGMNTITSDDGLPAVIGKNPLCHHADDPESVNKGSNSWANEPEGVDKSISDVFRAVREGFASAEVDYPLEYLHIQHDEPQFLTWLLMAGVGAECGNAFPYKGNFARGTVSAADTSFISALLENGCSLENAYRRLLADELYRRVTQAEEVFGKKVKLLFYADSFDDQSWGGVPWKVHFGNGEKIWMHGVIDLPGLDESQKKKVREKVIPVLWNYDGKVAFVKNMFHWLARADYDSDAAFDRFASKGYHFLYAGALQHGNASKKQIREYATAAKEHRDNCLGYYAAAWDVAYDPAAPDKKWDVIEYMRSVQNE